MSHDGSFRGMEEQDRAARRQARAERRSARRRSRGGCGGQRNDLWTRMIVGITLVAVGVIVWLDHLDRLDARDYLEWWPLIFIAFGISCLLQRRWVAAAFNLFFGLIFLPELPFLPQLHFGQILGVWPLLITAGGVTLIMQALRPGAKDVRGGGGFHSFTMMGGSSRTVSSEEFVGGDSVVVMGACDINLSKSTLTNEAVIDVLAFWGGIEIQVPRGWQVESHVAEILGAFVDRTTRPIGEDAPRLVIRGSAIMSGIEVKNPKEAMA